MDLTQQLKVILATTFATYIKAQSFHWNVVGPNFKEYHDLFGVVYQDLWGSIDNIAERIRTLGHYAPGSLVRFKELTLVGDQVSIPDAKSMIKELLEDLSTLVGAMSRGFEMATETGNHGIADYLGGQIDALEKHRWFLRASISD